MALGAVRGELLQAQQLRLVRFVLFAESDLASYAAALDELPEPPPG